jgi:hypothetical protein
MFVRVRFITKRFSCALYTQEQLLCKFREEFSYSVASGIATLLQEAFHRLQKETHHQLGKDLDITQTAVLVSKEFHKIQRNPQSVGRSLPAIRILHSYMKHCASQKKEFCRQQGPGLSPWAEQVAFSVKSHRNDCQKDKRMSAISRNITGKFPLIILLGCSISIYLSKKCLVSDYV